MECCADVGALESELVADVVAVDGERGPESGGVVEGVTEPVVPFEFGLDVEGPPDGLVGLRSPEPQTRSGDHPSAGAMSAAPHLVVGLFVLAIALVFRSGRRGGTADGERADEIDPYQIWGRSWPVLFVVGVLLISYAVLHLIF